MSLIQKAEEEIKSIDNIDEYINGLSKEEIGQKIIQFSKLYESKMQEILYLNQSLLSKETQMLSSNNNNIEKSKNSSSLLIGKNDNNFLDTLGLDENMLRIQHTQQIRDLEENLKEKIDKEMQRLNEEYKKEINILTQKHEEKIQEMEDEIMNLQMKIEEYKDEDKFIKKEEYEDKMNKIINQYKEENDKYDKQIEQIEELIKKKYSNLQIEGQYKIPIDSIPKFEIQSLTNKNFDEKMKVFKDTIEKQKTINDNSNKIALISTLLSDNNNTTYNESHIIIATDGSDNEEREYDCGSGENDNGCINALPPANYTRNIFKK